MSEEMVEVTIKLKVPKRLMQLIEERKYFGWKKKDFFLNAIRSIVGAEISEMPGHDSGEIYAKYGEDVDVVEVPN